MSISYSKTDFTNAAQTKITYNKNIDSTEYFEIQGITKYVGNSVNGLSNFQTALEEFIKNYKPGEVYAQKEITINDEDRINISNFTSYLYRELFNTNFENLKTQSNNKFSEFKQNSDSPFGNYSYNKNSIIFALLYYLDGKETESVKLQKPKNSSGSYNNLTFILSSCPPSNKEIRKQVDISFENEGYNSMIQKKITPNRLNGRLFSSRNESADYNFNIFKTNENEYRVYVELFDGITCGTPKLQKISNIMLKVE